MSFVTCLYLISPDTTAPLTHPVFHFKTHQMSSKCISIMPPNIFFPHLPFCIKHPAWWRVLCNLKACCFVLINLSIDLLNDSFWTFTSPMKRTFWFFLTEHFPGNVLWVASFLFCNLYWHTAFASNDQLLAALEKCFGGVCDIIPLLPFTKPLALKIILKRTVVSKGESCFQVVQTKEGKKRVRQSS